MNTTTADREKIRRMLARRYNGVIPDAEEMIDAMLDGLRGKQQRSPNRIAKPMPAAASHAPISVLNRTGQGIRTTVICSCEWQPKRAPQSASSMSSAHAAHRRSKGLPRADYAATVFGEGPWTGLTWDEWYNSPDGGSGIDPYTGSTR